MQVESPVATQETHMARITHPRGSAVMNTDPCMTKHKQDSEK